MAFWNRKKKEAEEPLEEEVWRIPDQEDASVHEEDLSRSIMNCCARGRPVAMGECASRLRFFPPRPPRVWLSSQSAARCFVGRSKAVASERQPC